MIKLSQYEPPKEARSFQVQLPVLDSKLLHRSIVKAKTSDITGGINWTGGMELPSITAYDTIVYSSQDTPQINPAGLPESGSAYIYTMTANVVENPREGMRKKTVVMTAGWTKWKSPVEGSQEEWVFVTFTPKWKKASDGSDRLKSTGDEATKYSHDLPKKAGKQFYEETYMNYATMTIGDELLSKIGFEEQAIDGGYGLADDFNANNQGALAAIRNQIDGVTPGGTVMADGSIDSDVPQYVIPEGYEEQFSDYYLHTARPYTKTFELPIKGGKDFKRQMVQRAEYPKISITVNFASLLPAQIAPGNPIPVRESPATVNVSFLNVPDDLPPIVFQSISKFLTQGLQADWIQYLGDVSSGSFQFRDGSKETNESISRMLGERGAEIEDQINGLSDENQRYGIDVQDVPPPDVDQRTQNPTDDLSKILKLEGKRLNVEKNLPMDLGHRDGHSPNTLSWKLKNRNWKEVTPRNINLMKLIQKEEE